MAVAAKDKGPASDEIMGIDKMKPLLAASKREPVKAAFGLTAGGDAVLLLDRNKKPKGVLSALKGGAAKGKIQLAQASLRFGRAEVDPEYDAAMIRFFINKDVPGNFRPRLLEVVKRASYQKVEFNVDTSLEEEPEEEDEATQPVAPAPEATVAPETVIPPAPPLPAPPPPDAASLGRALRALAARIPLAAGDDTARKASLLGLANDANTGLKLNDLAAATRAIEELRTSLDAAPSIPAAPVAPAADNATNFAKCRLIWESSRKKVEQDISRLTGALIRAYGVEGIGDEVADAFRQRVSPILNTFDESLSDKLDEAINQTDPERHAASVSDARALIERYTTFLSSEPLIHALDGNPLVPMAIEKTMGAALKALAATVR
jgi:hypothetical protein